MRPLRGPENEFNTRFVRDNAEITKKMQRSIHAFKWRRKVGLSGGAGILIVFLLFTLLRVPTALAHSARLAAQARASESSGLPTTPPNWPLVLADQTTPQQIVSNGVTVSTELLQTVAGPEQASLLKLDLSNPNLRLGIVQAHDHLFSADETVSSMATRSGAIAGVNGDFFDIYASGAPIGMEMIDGRIIQSPGQHVVLGQMADRSFSMNLERFAGRVSDDGITHTLTAINHSDDTTGNHLVLFTPDLGAPLTFAASTVVRLQPQAASNTAFTVLSVQSSATALPALSGEDALVGSGSAASWLATVLHPGDRLTTTTQIAPDANLVQAIGGGPQLVKDGAFYNDPHSPAAAEANQQNPLTAIALTKDGKHAFIVVFDGHEAGVNRSRGLTQPEMAGYLIAHGAYQAMQFDTGGSSDMVARLPGQRHVSVINTPSDGHERPVANGLFIYSTEARPGPATSVVVNQHQPLTLLRGTTGPLATYALDKQDNPAASIIRTKVYPSDLARVSSAGLITALRAGNGVIVVRAGSAWTTARLTVVDRLASLALSPSAPDLANGQVQQMQVTATARDGRAVALPLKAVRWRVDPASSGGIDANGLFTASASTVALGKITARAGGASASASVAVGRLPKDIAALTDVENWGITDKYMNTETRTVPVPGSHATSDGSIAASSTEKHKPSDAGSMQFHYTFPAGQHVLDTNAYPNDINAFQIPLLNGRQTPLAVGIWVKGNPALAGGSSMPLARGTITLTLGFYQADGVPLSVYATGLNFDGWHFVVAQLPQQGLSYPLKLNYMGLVIINPASDLSGDLYINDMQALYSPRPPSILATA